jgi:flagellar protein FlbD
MVKLTDLRGSEYILNAELIERIEENPDTQVVLISGHRHYVQERMETVVDRIVEYRGRCLAAADLLRKKQAE